MTEATLAGAAPADPADDSPALALGGQLRSVSPSALVRALRLATGLEMLSVSMRALLRVLLRAERRGEARFDGSTLLIVERRSILGRALPEKQVLVPLERVVSICSFDRRAELAQSAGLGALALGTLLGAGLFTQGIRTPGFAPSLVALGLLLAVAGGVLDFFLDRAAGRTNGTPHTSVRIVPARGPGYLLTGLTPLAAAHWLEQARLLLRKTD